MIPERNKRIKQILKEKKVTQHELAGYIGVKQATVNAQINSDREIDSIRTVDAVVYLTGCNRDWLMYGDGDKDSLLREPAGTYGLETSAPALISLVNDAKDKLLSIKKALEDRENINDLNEVVKIILHIGKENEALKEKIIKMYEKLEVERMKNEA